MFSIVFLSGVILMKSVKEIAQEVIAGLWGNGDDRKRRLTEAGYDYNVIQQAVNDLLNGNDVDDSESTVTDSEVLEVSVDLHKYAAVKLILKV